MVGSKAGGIKAGEAEALSALAYEKGRRAAMHGHGGANPYLAGHEARQWADGYQSGLLAVNDYANDRIKAKSLYPFDLTDSSLDQNSFGARRRV